MKLIAFNPHIDSWYGYNVFKLLTRRKSHRKFAYITQHLLQKDDIIFYLDYCNNSFPFFQLQKFSPFLQRLLSRCEFFLWCLCNRINPLATTRITDLGNAPKDAILFNFTYQNLDTIAPRFKATNIATLYHLSHFMLDTGLIAQHPDAVTLYAAENNLAKNSPYFQHHFPHYNKDVYTLPFVFQERFKKTKAFSERKNYCMATGTFETLTEKPRTRDFMGFFKIDTLHPMRKAIHLNRERLAGLVDSYISDYNEVKAKNSVSTDSKIKKLLTQVYNVLFVKQSKYFKFDIVQTYNDYKMFVVPEEANDLPGIGFVEGMACGGAYIGKDDPMYRDLGLIPGIHYIAYDNTIDGLEKTIRYYQAHNDELEQIAERGHAFVLEHFNGKAVANKFWGDIQALAMNKGPLQSSFVTQPPRSSATHTSHQTTPYSDHPSHETA